MGCTNKSVVKGVSDEYTVVYPLYYTFYRYNQRHMNLFQENILFDISNFKWGFQDKVKNIIKNNTFLLKGFCLNTVLFFQKI